MVGMVNGRERDWKHGSVGGELVGAIMGAWVGERCVGGCCVGGRVKGCNKGGMMHEN